MIGEVTETNESSPALAAQVSGWKHTARLQAENGLQVCPIRMGMADEGFPVG